MQLRFKEAWNESTQGATANTKATSISPCSISRNKKSRPERGFQASNTRRSLTANIISGRIINRYHCLQTLSKMTGIGSELLAKANKKMSYPKKKRLPEKSRELTEKIITFLERSNNSRMMPGKADFVTFNGAKVQKR